jgi:tetratricopeptide (TPR) repeat protein
VPALLLTLLLAAPPHAEAAGSLARGDAAWGDRIDLSRGVADRVAVEAALSAYREGLERAPGSLEAHWKVLRALYFEGEYVAGDEAARRSAFSQGKALSSEALALLDEAAGRPLDDLPLEELAAAVPDPSGAARVYFWTAVVWGKWADTVGKLAAARQGVAGKIRDWAEKVIALDEGYEHGGGHRLLGRLHTEAPRIPFVTGWVDRDRAVSELERALEIDPLDPLNRLYLGEALWRFRPRQRARARALLRSVVEDPGAPEEVLAWKQARARALRLLGE